MNQGNRIMFNGCNSQARCLDCKLSGCDHRMAKKEWNEAIVLEIFSNGNLRVAPIGYNHQPTIGNFTNVRHASPRIARMQSV
jgi:hypothetical protein